MIATLLADPCGWLLPVRRGFGRIGRTTFRYAWDMPELEIVAVNEIVGGSETAAYLVQFDSVRYPSSSWTSEDSRPSSCC